MTLISQDQGKYVATDGEFIRDTTYISDRIVTSAHPGIPTAQLDGTFHWPVEPNRYRLIAARACPWAHRTVIVRSLLGLDKVISLGLAAPTHDVRSWNFDLDPAGVDPVLGISRLQDAYFKRFPNYPRGITVPAIVDVPTGTVVTNDYASMTLDFSTEWHQYHKPDAPDLYPEDLRPEIDELNAMMFTTINNGVYRCGFSGSQDAYNNAFDQLFGALDTLEERLADTSWVIASPRLMFACSPPWCVSTPCTTTISSATATASATCLISGATSATSTKHPGSVTPRIFSRSKSTITLFTGISTPPELFRKARTPANSPPRIIASG